MNNVTIADPSVTSPSNRNDDHLPRPEEQFRAFVSQSMGFVVALVASMPMLTDWLRLVKLPGPAENQNGPSFLPVLATAVSALVFLALFWTRDRIASIPWVVCGITLVLSGASLLALTHRIAEPHPDTATATYLLGFPLMLGGVALVFLYGFVRYQERAALLQQLLPRLEADQWASLMQFTRTQIAVRDSLEALSITPRAKEALARSAETVILAYNEMLAKLQGGMLEIRGPDMDDVFAYFMAGVERSFRALSRDDLDYWASSDSARYLDANARVIQDGHGIERIFLLRRNKRLTDEHIEALRRQVRSAIRMRIAYLEHVQGIVADDRDLDFGLLDSFAVSFWRFASGRVFRISTAPGDCKRYEGYYKKVSEACVSIPGKSGPDAKVIEREEEFDAWLKSTQN